VRIASYNVRNLLAADEAALAGVPVKTEKEILALAGTIDAVRADVLLLQEVGSRQILASLNDRLARPYPYLDVQPGNSPRGIHLAIMSREPYDLTSHREATLLDEAGDALHEYDSEADAAAARLRPVRFQRDLMLAEISLDDAPTVALFNVHLKSRTNRPWRRLAADVIRAAEVRHLSAVVSDYVTAHPRRPLVIGGDFNDTRSSPALAPLFALPLSDPMGEVLARTGRNPSTYWPKRRMRLDLLLLSPSARSRLVPGSEKIHAGTRARRASDHYPVSIDLGYTAAQ
jgi:endonuclease/exonuclease/phosphatase family metal-dependent hydrolase